MEIGDLLCVCCLSRRDKLSLGFRVNPPMCVVCWEILRLLQLDETSRNKAYVPIVGCTRRSYVCN